MAENKPEGAKPVSVLSRRDQFAAIIAGALLARQGGTKPETLARTVVQYTDAFLAELDKPRGN